MSGFKPNPTSQQATSVLLTANEAAAYLNVPVRWVSEAARLRRMRCTRIGKHLRFRVEHLDELIAAGEQPLAGKPDGPTSLHELPTPRRAGARARL